MFRLGLWRFLVIFSAAIFALSCTGNGKKSADGKVKKPAGVSSTDIKLTTEDGIKIAGTFFNAGNAQDAPGILLIHMLGKDRSTYADFQKALAEKGFMSLAIDLRGHGGSTQDGTLDFNKFTKDEWMKAINDINSGIEYLMSQTSDGIGIVGASIGANLAVVAVSEAKSSGKDFPVDAIILMSPGLNYRGVQPLLYARGLEKIPVLVVSAENDKGSYPGSQSMSQAARGGELKTVSGEVHGTDILSEIPGISQELIDWLYSKINRQSAEIESPENSGENPGETNQ
ncbi:MAG: alpha/beta fold hydrolase [bacterium]